ncbi:MULTISPECIES: DUF4360 domain-containing protein [Streptomyces]|uniref:DUF4360 domain-containing protein n=3 Tax=Streptomyces TaxID=1883 RepID=A0ABX6W7G4_STRMQ|nr:MULTISPECIES: DUF4360 domain-containing protein [Streptomyces]MYU14245.1 DUF4360 domain-containing protein [Streptomyces sp. SID8361]AQA11262.1 hypothetical protein BV401_13015 [Streptomyces autolyticus]ATL82142.1 secreted protein [Streptomyces malaysiensis]AUA14551.1 hypothetical protein CFP59_06730 [Streptomyces sp. M56]MCC4317130.1 DUF4360 domain-containing protein [Streptomyces malaysiensis]
MSGVLLAGGAAAALFASALSTQGVSSAPDGPPEKIQISVKTVNGSGCPKGTTAVAVAADNSAFTVTYSDYLAQVGPDADPIDIRKNCQLSLGVHVPQGFTYAIAQVDYRGYGHLEKGAKGTEKASYYFQGSADTASRTHEFSGPYNDNWQTTDSTDYSALVWAPCGQDRNFNVNTELRVGAGTSPAGTTSFMAMDSTDGGVNTIYHLAWKECPSAVR